MDNGLFMSPQNAELDSFNGDYTPDLDYLDGEGYDFENADLGGEMIGALPGDGHEKRKNPDEQDEDDEGDPKRQETHGGEKGAKKPGRKPLMSEPTTKRKAQNRAAQRAFRERKERHLKDLETKVSQLTKTQEADKHENGLLKAQVGRLQVELKDYRKRLSLNGGAAKGSPPLTAHSGQNRSNSGPNHSSGSDFHFDFPKFGALPGSQIFGNQLASSNGANNGAVNRGSVTPPTATQSPTAIGGPGALPNKVPAPPSRENSSNGRGMSPGSGMPQVGASKNVSPSQYANMMPSVGYSSTNNMHGFAGTLPQMGDGNLFGDLFSPSLLKSASVDGNIFFGNTEQVTNHVPGGLDNTGGDSTAGLNRVFQFNSGSTASDSASPSASSSSQWNANANSSCGTSPEPSHDSPINRTDKNADSFCDKITPHSSISDASKVSNQQMNANFNVGLTGNNLDYSVQSSATFDPVLFGDYRENQNTSFGGIGDFSNGFFDEALNSAPYDFGSPSNLFGILQSPQQTHGTLKANSGQANASVPSRNLMAEIEKTRDGGDDDYGLTNIQQKKSEGSGKLISCNNIWNQLQSNADFQAGTFDLDNLCSELRKKARCSESGVMVDQEHVDTALKKLGKRSTGPAPDLPPLMFEQDSWDAVLKRMGENSGQF
ncbi:hypothetical protein LTR36_006330 [Oleoguttula mirabilis]|uniref:BZIP domain-containing protein n=1 Tax=Oleoguttula mirabilis TaxID=1507867 RepID=A0AAV9JUR5_9PEZI|nr:hypothetical protein LTR36_006330 [Oleoguttula mirabilis]